MRSTCETPEQSQRRAAGGGGSGGKAIGQGEWVVAKQVLNTVSEETDGMASSTTVQDGKPPLLAKGHACSRLTDLQIEQLRIRQAAQKDKKLQFTALWHHVYNVDCLRDAYLSIKRHAAPGLDDLTWQQYGENLEANLQDLSDRLKRGAYQEKPVK